MLATRVRTAYLKDALGKVDSGHPNFSRECHKIRIRDALMPRREREVARLEIKKAWINHKDRLRKEMAKATVWGLIPADVTVIQPQEEIPLP